MTTGQLAIFGGMFDPPHNGHLLAINQVLEKVPEITNVHIVPAYQHAWKKGHAQAHQRLHMSRLLFKTIENCTVSDGEIQRKGVSYTIDTVKQYSVRYRLNYPLNVIIGSDGLRSLSKWNSYVRLIDMVRFIVVPRVGFQLSDAPKSAVVLDGDTVVQTNISSTYIRTRVANKQSIAGLVPSSVEDYIVKSQLYL